MLTECVDQAAKPVLPVRYLRRENETLDLQPSRDRQPAQLGSGVTLRLSHYQP